MCKPDYVILFHTYRIRNDIKSRKTELLGNGIYSQTLLLKYLVFTFTFAVRSGTSELRTALTKTIILDKAVKCAYEVDGGRGLPRRLFQPAERPCRRLARVLRAKDLLVRVERRPTHRPQVVLRRNFNFSPLLPAFACSYTGASERPGQEG